MSCTPDGEHAVGPVHETSWFWIVLEASPQLRHQRGGDDANAPSVVMPLSILAFHG